MRGARTGARPQVDFSERLRSCLIPSSHGNRRLWRTWPTYVTVCTQTHANHLLPELCTAARGHLERLPNESIGDQSLYKQRSNEMLLPVFERLSMSWVNNGCQSHWGKQPICVYNRHCKHTRLSLSICWHIISDKMDTLVSEWMCFHLYRSQTSSLYKHTGDKLIIQIHVLIFFITFFISME